MSHAYKIGARLVDEITILVTDMANEAGADDTMTRTSQLPNVSFRKRRSAKGREDAWMRIEEGITIVPLKPARSPGTNERDGVGYKFMIAIAFGTYRDELDDVDQNDWPIAEYEEAIRRRFHNSRICNIGLTDACELRTAVEPGELPDWAKLKIGMDATYLTLIEYIRESRNRPAETP